MWVSEKETFLRLKPKRFIEGHPLLGDSLWLTCPACGGSVRVHEGTGVTHNLPDCNFGSHFDSATGEWRVPMHEVPRLVARRLRGEL